MSKLIHLPNISSELEQKLLQVNVDTPDKLREKGSRNAFVKIKTIDSSACYDMLLALEGAVQGVLIEELDPTIRQELKKFMEIFNQ